MNELIKTIDITLKTALKFLSKSGQKCLVIVNKNKKLIGTLSDGDIRKAIVSNKRLNSKISNIYQKNPVFLQYGKYTTQHAKKLFLHEKFDIIPVVDSKHKVVEILRWEEIFGNNYNKDKLKNNKNNLLNVPVVIMAGGKGSRLEPFSEVLPKPLIPINGKTIIETILEKFYASGFRNYNFIVNYKSLILKAYLQEIKKKYTLNFFEEKKPLGTIGGISLLKRKIYNNFFVSNCDVIINTDYSDLYNHHIKNSNDVTLVATTKEYVIPYGDCKLDKSGNLSKIIEKPKFDFLINSGLYVFNKRVIKMITPNQYLDFNKLIDILKKNNYKIGVYPIHEHSWIDVGQWSEYKNSIEKL